MATLLCDNCLTEVEADTMTTMLLIDVMRTVCASCVPILEAQGFVIVYPLEEGGDNA